MDNSHAINFAELPNLITEPEAAKRLCISHGTLKAARLGNLPENPLCRLPHVKIGRSIRYRRRDIDDWINQNLIR